MKRTEADLAAIEAKKSVNKIVRKEGLKLRKQAKKSFKTNLKSNTTKKLTSKTALKRANPQRHIGFMTMRASKYPMEFTMKTHNVYLNPLKKMVKGSHYKCLEYQDVLTGIIKDFMMKQEAAIKAQQDTAQAPAPAVEANNG